MTFTLSNEDVRLKKGDAVMFMWPSRAVRAHASTTLLVIFLIISPSSLFAEKNRKPRLAQDRTSVVHHEADVVVDEVAHEVAADQSSDCSSSSASSDSSSSSSSSSSESEDMEDDVLAGVSDETLSDDEALKLVSSFCEWLDMAYAGATDKDVLVERFEGIMDAVTRTPRIDAITPQDSTYPVGHGVALNVDKVLKCLCEIKNLLGTPGECPTVFDCLEVIVETLCDKFEQTWTILEDITDRLACFTDTPITEPIVITEPGTYCVPESFIATNTEAIIVDADNVKIDLNCKMLVSDGGDSTIVVAEGRCNVTIANGSVKNISGGDGIKLQGGTKGVVIDSVHVSDAKNGLVTCGTPGSSKGSIENSSFNNNTCNGLLLENADGFKVMGSDFTSNTTGVLLINSDSNCFEGNCASCNDIAGFALIDSMKNSFMDNKALRNGADENAYGFVSSGGMCNKFSGNLVECTMTTTLCSTFVAAGIALLDGEKNSIICDSTISNISTATGGCAVPYGILLQCDLDTLVSCTTGDHDNLNLFALDWSPNGRFLVVGGQQAVDGNEIRVFEFNAATNALTLRSSVDFGNAATVCGLEWSPDGTRLVAVGSDPGTNQIKLYSFNAATGVLTLEDSFTHGAKVRTVSWRSDNTTIAVGGDTVINVQIRLFNTTGNTLTQIGAGFIHGAPVYSVDWSRGGDYLAVGGEVGVGGADTRIYSYDGIMNLAEVSAAVHSNTVRSVQWSPCACYLATGGESANLMGDSELRLYEFNRDTEQITLVDSLEHDQNSKDINSVDWSSDGRYLSIGGVSATNLDNKEIRVYLFNAIEKTLTQFINLDHGNEPVNGVAWSPSNKQLAIVGNSAASDDAKEVRIFCGTFICPEKNLIKNNTITGVSGGFNSGVGIAGTCVPTNNLIINNFAFCNDTNYIFVPNVYDNGLFCEPRPFDNICFPPFVGTCTTTDNLDELICEKFEDTWTALDEITEVLCEKFEDTWTILQEICDKLACLGANEPITGPVVITEPGCYCVANDFDVSTTGILIAADDVRIDFNNKVLCGVNGTDGVVVQAGHQRIDLMNGTIKNMSNAGIVLGAGSSKVSLHGMHVGDSGNGLITQGTPGPNNVIIEGSSFCGNTENGLWLDYANNVRVMGTDLSSNGTGATLTNAVGNMFEDVTASNNSLAGVSLVDSDKNNFRSVKVVNTTSDQFAYGFITDSGMCNVFNDVFVECVTTATLCPPIYAAGVVFRNDERNSQVFNSTISNIMTPTTGCAPAYGILFDCSLDALTSGTRADHQNNQVYSTDWHPNGAFLATGGQDLSGEEVRIFAFTDTTDKALVQTDVADNGGADVRSVAWSSSGDCLVTGGDTGNGIEVRLYSFDSSAGTITQEDTAVHGALVRSVAWSPDNQYVAIGGDTGTGGFEIRVYSVDLGAKTLTQIVSANTTHGGSVYSVAWSHDGQYLAIGGDSVGGVDTRVYSFDGTTLTQVSAAQHSNTVRSVAWSGCSCFLATGGESANLGGDFEIRLYEFNTATGTLTLVDQQQHDSTSQDIYSVDWSSDSRYLAVGGESATNVDQKEVRIFALNPVLKILVPVGAAATFDHGNEAVFGVAWSPSDKHLAIVGEQAQSDDAEIRVACVNYLCPSKVIVKNNMISGVQSGAQSGVGIQAPCQEHDNLIIQNTAFCNDTNYRFIANVYDKGTLGRAMTFDNACFPPFDIPFTDPIVEQLCDKFEQTWTDLQGIEDVICRKFEETWTAIEAIDIQVNIILDDEFAGTWTAIQDVKDTMCRKFEETWTVLNRLQESEDNHFDELTEDFEETWTILADIKATMCRKFEETWTVEQDIKDTTCRKFEETWTVLQDLKDELIADNEETWTVLQDIKDTTCRKFEETWTVLNRLQESEDDHFDELTQDFEETWTVLQDIKDTTCRKFEETWTVLQDVKDTMCSKFEQTWTSLACFTDIPISGPITITTPGTYCVVNSFAATNENGITIDSDNVVINLNGKVISSSSGTDSGISIATDNDNIVVKNGTVSGFNRGIVGTNANCVRIDNVVVVDIQTTGNETVIDFNNCADLKITNCKFSENGADSPTDAVVRLDSCECCILEDIEANANQINDLGSVFNLDDTIGSTFRRCKVCELSADDSAFGFYLEGASSSNQLIECVVTQVTVGSAFYGFYLDGGNAVENRFDRCHVTQSVTTPAGGDCNGFRVSGASHNLFADCTAVSLAAGSGAAECVGFRLVSDSESNILVRCIAQCNQSTTDDVLVAGFDVDAASGDFNEFKDCQAVRNINTADDSDSFGFRDLSTTDNNTYPRNIASHNGGDPDNQFSPIGAVGDVFTEWVAQKVGAGPITQPGAATGPITPFHSLAIVASP